MGWWGDLEPTGRTPGRLENVCKGVVALRNHAYRGRDVASLNFSISSFATLTSGMASHHGINAIWIVDIARTLWAGGSK